MKKCNAILLPTERASKIIRYGSGEYISYAFYPELHRKQHGDSSISENQELYITYPGKKAKKGDWFIFFYDDGNHGLFQYDSDAGYGIRATAYGVTSILRGSSCSGVIVGTTNPDLGLPQLEESFLKEWCLTAPSIVEVHGKNYKK